MIKLFGQTDKTFTTNGDKVITPLKAKIHKEDNGSYYLDLETGLEYVNDLTEGRIVVVPTPQGEQGFRVGNVQKTKRKLVSKCYHLFYDTENYLILDSYVVNKDCNDALDHLNSATTPASPFTTISDVGTIDSFRCVRKSLYEAIQTVIERWGGHLVRDNFNIGIRTTIGQDNGVTVRYAKNLKDITCQENWDNVVTDLYPTGYDGIMLEEKHLVSETQYQVPYTKTVHFDQDIDQELFTDEEGNLDEEAYQQALREDLLVQATEYLNTNCVPQVNYTISADLEKITDVGDTVQVIDERLGVNILTNVISFDYDCILRKYTKVEFGNFKQTLSGLVGNITSNTNQTIQNATTAIESNLASALEQAQEAILGQLGSSYVILTDPSQILIVDTLPMESATNVIRMNNGGIAFSQSGINGDFTTAWTIDGTFNAQAANVINFTASMIKGGTLKLGSNLNQNGQLELYDESNNLIVQMTKDGLQMNCTDGSYILINGAEGLVGYNSDGKKVCWVSQDEFHQKKSVVEEEITIANKLRFIPITLTDDDGNITNDGIGLVSVAGGVTTL